jgi:hypothetical protein
MERIGPRSEVGETAVLLPWVIRYQCVLEGRMSKPLSQRGQGQHSPSVDPRFAYLRASQDR